jgi:transcriptional regulator GlxA family with amidase domain
VVVASPQGGNVSSSCGLSVATTRCRDLAIDKPDTVLVVGAYERSLAEAMRNGVLARTLQGAAEHAQRYGSVCSGTFLLAAAGVLAGRRVATHWAGCTRLAGTFKEAVVEADALYVVDGRLWTSAGVTTGIDMALAMLASDHGPRLMGQVAKQLIVYAHRPGHQSQFSALLSAQSAADGSFADLVLWLESRIQAPIKVSDMARRAGMSERTFHRKFTAATGMTPSKYRDGLRLERAKRYLESRDRVKKVAARIGFKSESAFRTAFRQQFGITPSHHSRMQASLSPRKS